jgi:hypothetical protein
MKIILLSAVLLLQAPAAATVEVSLDQARVDTTVGTRLTVVSRVSNTGTRPTDPLVAHLNVASLDGVYTDLEDWSADVTRTVPPLAPGARTSLTWQFQAVNPGNFDVYVAALPAGPTSAGGGPIVVSPPLHVRVATRTPVTASGALAVVLIIPAILGTAAAALAVRRRRSVSAGR